EHLAAGTAAGKPVVVFRLALLQGEYINIIQVIHHHNPAADHAHPAAVAKSARLGGGELDDIVTGSQLLALVELGNDDFVVAPVDILRFGFDVPPDRDTFLHDDGLVPARVELGGDGLHPVMDGGHLDALIAAV